MYPISNSNRSDGAGKIPSQNGTTQAALTNKQLVKELITHANTVPLPIILRHYGIRIDAQNTSIICPFLKHKGGRESTPSFHYKPDNNSFWCYGCKSGRDAVDFVATMENIAMGAAARKIIELFGSDVDVNGIDLNPAINYSERVEIYMDFSNCIHESIHLNMDDPVALSYFEEITLAFDKMNEKYSLSNEALKSLVFKLKEKIQQYQR
jgi:hypothetical protein